MIKIATALCADRHPVLANAYDDRLLPDETAKARVLGMLSGATCSRCSSPGPFVVECSPTAFKTLEEALPHMNLINSKPKK